MIQSILKTIIDRLVSTWRAADEVARAKAVNTVEMELEETEHVFALLVLGSFVGIPAPPVQVSLDLMPWMENELMLMLEKVDTAGEPLSHLFSVFEIG